jgi:tRNA dimethylallyltransferase
MKTTQKLISVLGTTAAGKTSLTLYLAEKILKKNMADGICIISADSRQVYQGLETLTGTDIPPNFKFKNLEKSSDYCRFLKHNDMPITLHGVSIVSPIQDWSVAHFRNMAIDLIKQAWKKNWLPIIVGGTTFYHKQLFNNDPDIYIKPNQKLRKSLAQKSIKELKELLEKADPKKLGLMNASDRANPRRLIRAIEVAKSEKKLPKAEKNRPIFNEPEQYLSIALQIELETLQRKILTRVKQRFHGGAIKEVKHLLSLKLKPTAQVMTSLGVKPITQYIANKLTAQETIQVWAQDELNYAKKQITWLKQMSVDLKIKTQDKNAQTKIWNHIKKTLNS